MNLFRNKFLLTPLIYLCLIIPYGCNRYQESYFPLDKGFRWLYSIDSKTIDGRRVTKYIVENIGSTVLDGHKVSARRSWDGTTYYYRKDANGVLRIGENLLDNSARFYLTPIVVLPNPATLSSPPWSNLGHTVMLRRAGSPKAAEAITRINEQLQMNYVVKSVNDDVDVPAGRFGHCLRVRGTGVTDIDLGLHLGPTKIQVEVTEWYAHGVGLIKYERKETTNSPLVAAGEYRMVLEEFRRASAW